MPGQGYMYADTQAIGSVLLRVIFLEMLITLAVGIECRQFDFHPFFDKCANTENNYQLIWF